MLDLIPSVIAILDRVRVLTGKEFRFIEKYELLDDYVSVRMGLTNSSEHLVFYTPQSDDIVNHLIAHECVHILRIWNAPPEKRVIPIATAATQDRVMSQLQSEIARVYPKLLFPVAAEMVSIHYRALIHQLASQPADPRVEKWLYFEYPDLREIQAKSLKRQARKAEEALTQTAKSTPVRLYDAAGAMHYAAYRLIDEYTHLHLCGPFKRNNFRYRGDELYGRARLGQPDTYEGDIALIDQWAALLGLTGWFVWQDIEAADIGNADQVAARAAR